MWTVLAASTTETVTAVGVTALLSVSITFMLNSSRRAREEIKEARHENALCTWRQTVLAETMHAANLPVPSWIWGDAPDGVAKMTQEDMRVTARRMIDPFAAPE